MKKIILQLLLFACVLSFFSCNKNNINTNGNKTAQARIHLTDGPAIYDHVYIDIQQIQITMSGGSAITLTPFRPGIYDILSFSNGLDTLLVNATLPAGSIDQIRLILGPDNSIVVNGTAYALNTPSAQESGLKLNLDQTLVAGGAYDIWIDFDAGKSILQTGSGKYKLKPVIRAYSSLTNGQIVGDIMPLNAEAIVYATDGIDTFSAIPDPVTGAFVISGMTSGTYQLWVTPGLAGLNTYTQSDIVVSYGKQVDLGTITLHL